MPVYQGKDGPFELTDEEAAVLGLGELQGPAGFEQYDPLLGAILSSPSASEPSAVIPAPTAPEPAAPTFTAPTIGQQPDILDEALGFPAPPPALLRPETPGAPAEPPAELPPPVMTRPIRTGFRDIDAALAEAGATSQAAIGSSFGAIDEAKAAREEEVGALDDVRAELPAVEEAERAAADARISSIEDTKKNLDEIQNQVEDLAKKEPDPGRGWANRGGFQRAAAFVAAIVQGGLNPRAGSNPVVDMIINEIDKDVARQMDQMNRQMDALRERKALVGQKFDMEAARIDAEFAMRTSRYRSMERMFDLASRRADSQDKVANLQLAKAQLLQGEARNRESLGMQAANIRLARSQLALQRESMRAKAAEPFPVDRAVKGPDGRPLLDANGRPLLAATKQEAERIRADIDSWGTLDALWQEYMAKAEEISALDAVSGLSEKARSEARQDLDSMAEKIVTMTRNLSEKGVMTDRDVERARKALPETTAMVLTGRREGVTERITTERRLNRKTVGTKIMTRSSIESPVTYDILDPQLTALPAVPSDKAVAARSKKAEEDLDKAAMERFGMSAADADQLYAEHKSGGGEMSEEEFFSGLELQWHKFTSREEERKRSSVGGVSVGRMPSGSLLNPRLGSEWIDPIVRDESIDTGTGGTP